jgi:Flp pilus assembly protein CpaB
MRRGRVLIFVLLIVIIGLVVAFVAIRQLLASAPSQSVAPANVEVFVAGQNIPQGGKITQEVLATKTLPQTLVTSDMYTTAQRTDLLNNKIAAIPLSQGVPITRGEVANASTAISIPGPSWAAVIPPGMVAASIPATRFALSAYSVADGAHVNVNACFQFVDIDSGFQSILPNHTAQLTGTGVGKEGGTPVLSLTVNSGGAASTQGRIELEPSVQQPYYVVPSEPQRGRTVCQTILQDVVVMKVGNFPQVSSTQTAAQQQQTQQQQAQQPATTAAPDILTLIVSPQDADMLDYMVYTSAQITLVLRNPNDQSRQATNAITLQFALSQYNIPVPAKLPYGTQPRVDALVQPTLPNDAAAPPK